MSTLKTKLVTIPVPKEGERENRDAGKTYLLTEMPALQAERWGRHAIAACSRNDLDLKGEVAKLGLLGFYLVGFQALAGGDIHAVDALMDQMLTCIKIVESPTVARPLGGDGDICEVATLVTLRKELIELHLSFTFAELASILVAASATAVTDSPNTPTSQASSET
jgi:hypothetical protein